MPENQSPFSKHYHAALDRHLRQRASSLRPPRAARALGPKAFALGLDPLDLVQVHDRALNGLNLSGSRIPAPSSDGAPTQAGSFLLAALTSLAEVQHAHRQTAATAPRLVASLRARSSALTRVRRQLQREVARRKLAEQQLSLGTRHYNRLLAQSRQLQIQSRRLAHQVLTAQEEERKEISRELHDEVAQILAGINVQLAALKEASAIGSRGLRRRINQTQQLVQRSVKVVHRYARELRPALLDDLGLIPALRAYIRDLPGRKSLQISFTAFPGVEDLDNLRRTVLYRVAQEALTNVTRHAHARTVRVRIRPQKRAVLLEVLDDGRSFPVARMLASNTRKRLGLLGMRERVEMVGGVFAVDSAPGRGTTVRAIIPFQPHAGGGGR